jgi:prevent-host-death family protein
MMTMIMVNIFEMKAKLSEYLEAVGRGERVVICKRNRPVAELRAVAEQPSVRRLGAAAGAVTIPPAFFEPLPDDLLEAFEGGPLSLGQVSRIAERRAEYEAKPRRRK